MSADIAFVPLKIAVWHNLSSGGGKRALYDHVTGLLSRGHHVVVWCPETADPDYLPLAAITREHRLPLSLPVRGRHLRRAMDKLLGRDGLLAAMDAHCRRAAAEIAAGGFDVVFTAPCVLYRVPRLGRWLSALTGLNGNPPPRVLYLQEPNRMLYEALPELPWLAPPCLPPSVLSPREFRARASDFFRLREIRRSGRREWEDMRHYKRVLVNSLYSRENVARAYGVDPRLCYLGVDSMHFHPPVDPQNRREDFLLGLGSMDFIKGVDTAVRAVSALPARRRLPLVWIANSGEPHYAEQTLALAKTLDVHLEIRRRVPEAELVGLLQRARLLLYTSRLEPFGYAPLEANACGLPVVAVAEGGVRETVVDGVNGLLCERDPEALARAMERLLADPNLAATLGETGRRLVQERWTVAQGVERLDAHLRAVVAGNAEKG